MTTITSGSILDSKIENIARAISAFADESRADSALLLSTSLVASDARITDSGEGYTGVVRWLDYTDPTSEQKPTEVVGTDLGSTQLLTIGNQIATYIKNVDVIGAQEASIQSLISKTDGLSYLGSKFGAVRARREEQNLRSVLLGIAKEIYGTTNVGTDTAAAVIGSFGYSTGTTGTALNALFTATSATSAAPARSNFFDTLLNAMTAVSGEFEDPFYYLVIDAETFNTLRKENVLDGNTVQDGNLNVATLLGGKIRLIVSGTAISNNATANQLDSVTSVATTNDGTVKVSFLMKSGAVHYSNIAMNNPTAIDNNPLAANGGGAVTIVSRWGNIIHPRGYSYTGTSTTYPANSVLATGGNWTKVAKNVNQTGIFPIFHG